MNNDQQEMEGATTRDEEFEGSTYPEDTSSPEPRNVHEMAPSPSATAEKLTEALNSLQSRSSFASRSRLSLSADLDLPPSWMGYKSAYESSFKTYMQQAAGFVQNFLFTTRIIVVTHVVLLGVSLIVGVISIREKEGLRRVMLALLLGSQVVVAIAGTVYAVLRQLDLNENTSSELNIETTSSEDSGSTIVVDENSSID